MRSRIPASSAYGTSGVGSPHHLAGELLRQKTGIDIQHVPYRGGGAAVNDLLGGHIGMAFLSLSAVVPHINTGKVAHRRDGGEDALCGDAGHPDHRRDRSGLRDVVLARHLRAGRNARRRDREAQ